MGYPQLPHPPAQLKSEKPKKDKKTRPSPYDSKGANLQNNFNRKLHTAEYCVKMSLFNKGIIHLYYCKTMIIDWPDR